MTQTPVASKFFEVFERVKKVVAFCFDVPFNQVRLGTFLREDLGAESIDFVEMIVRLEDEFGVRIGRGTLFPEGNNKFIVSDEMTVRDVVTYVCQQLEQQGADMPVIAATSG